MSDLLILGILASSICLVLSFALWRMVEILGRISGANLRSLGQEKRDYTDVLERAMERATTATHEQLQLAHIHAMERVEKARRSTEVDIREASQGSIPPTPEDPGRIDSPEDVMARVLQSAK